MNRWSECKLDLEIRPARDGRRFLVFTQSVLGFSGALCEIDVEEDAGRWLSSFSRQPDFLSRGIFRLTHGLKEFEPLFAVVGKFNRQDAVCFYQCRDRKGRNRVLASATTSAAGGDGGGTFMISRENFERVAGNLGWEGILPGVA